MIRWIAVLTTLLLSGCVTTEYVYRDRDYDDGYAETRRYDDGYYDERRYERDGSYYSPPYSGRGDYYYGQRDYYASGYPSWYADYPAYYSLFWGLNRTWYDPYWYPNYYYGVTYYPRNYFSISLSSGWGRPHYGYQYYSPYRYSWVDNYYDWSPWRGHYSHNRYYRPTPRFGSARNEAERLSRMSDDSRYSANPRRDGGLSGGYGRDTAIDRYGSARGGTRDADYGGRTAPRQDPGARGFGVPTQDGSPRSDVRRNATYGREGVPRQDPGTRGFGVPTEGNVRNNAARGADYGDTRQRELPPTRGFGVESPNTTPRNTAPSGYGRDARYGAQREINRVGTTRGYPNEGIEVERANAHPYTRYEREPRTRGYDAGVALPRQGEREATSGYDRGYRYERAPREPAAREYSRQALPAPRYEPAPAADSGGYRMPTQERYSAPMPESRSYSPPAEARGYSAPEPRYSAPEPVRESRFESRPEPRPESDSDSGDRGVRRVGSNRDD